MKGGARYAKAGTGWGGGILSDRIALSRRRALAGAAAAAVAPGPALAQSRTAGMDLTIIYVGAKDCPPCQVFKNQDLPHWSRSPSARSVRFVHIEAPRMTGAYSARYWPSNYRFVLQQVTVPIVPQFFLLEGNIIVKSAAGISGWRSQILPMIPGVVSGGSARMAP
jgi:hypothetical protein